MGISSSVVNYNYIHIPTFIPMTWSWADVFDDARTEGVDERVKVECCVMSATNECMTAEQKSSAEILDGLFRELEEKSAKGQLPVQADLCTVLGNTLTIEDLHHRHSHRKRKSSKHKHSHKHKKRKKHRKSSQTVSGNSSDEWVPAEEQKLTAEVGKIAGQSQNPSPNDAEKIEDSNPMCSITAKPVVTFDQKDVNDVEIPNSECDMDILPLQKDITNLEISNEVAIVSPLDTSRLAPKSLLIHNEQVLFLPRVTCLDRRASHQKPLCISGDQDPVPLASIENSTISVESPVVEGNQSNAVIIDSITEEETSRNDESVDESPSIANKRGKQVSKLKSKINCSSIKKVSKKHSAKPKIKTKLKKKTSTEKNDLSTDKKLRDEAHDKKRKIKKHSKSKSLSSRSRDRSKSTSPRNTCSLSRSSTRKSPSRSPTRKSRSRSPKSEHSKSRSRHSKSKTKTRSHSNSRERNKRRMTSPSSWLGRDRSKTVATILGEKIDKAKLLAIAKKNAMAMMADGRLPVPVTLNMETPKLEKFRPIPSKPSGKSVEELTDFCKLLAKREKEEGELSGDDLSKPHHSSDEEDKGVPFVHHHPFKLKEQPNIIMNIRNAVQIPIKTPAEKVAEGSKLRIQFPVSSGTQHRKKEWVPVSPKKTPEVVKEKLVVPLVEEATVFQPQHENTVDIGAIVSQRLKAVRQLMDNPHDVEALNQMYKSQQEMQNWAQSKQLPGQFTGTTDVQILTPEQLAGPAHLQAWVKKDQFNRAAPVQGGFGMYMLQKMGWKPGEGLGKNKEGTAEPIILDIKTDKKGLVSQGEVARKNVTVTKDLSGKHPVSALVELCNKRRWLPPEFILVHDSGPDHKKNFVFKVRVNGQEFQPSIASLNKKHAKAQSATVCLQTLGLVPRDLSNPL